MKKYIVGLILSLTSALPLIATSGSFAAPIKIHLTCTVIMQNAQKLVAICQQNDTQPLLDYLILQAVNFNYYVKSYAINPSSRVTRLRHNSRSAQYFFDAVLEVKLPTDEERKSMVDMFHVDIFNFDKPFRSLSLTEGTMIGSHLHSLGCILKISEFSCELVK